MSALTVDTIFQYRNTTNFLNLSYKKDTINNIYIFDKKKNDSIPNFQLNKDSIVDVNLALKKDSNLTIPINVNIENMNDTTKRALLAATLWAKKNGYKVTITSGFRNYKKQSKLYKQKPNIADNPEHSMHCKGLAFDIGLFPKNSTNKIRDPKIYLKLAEALKQENFNIYNGRDFPDAPKDSEWKEAWHFQIGKNDGFLFYHAPKKAVKTSKK